MEEKTKRLEQLLQKIERSESKEYEFDNLYRLLKAEFESEGGENGDYVKGNYRHNLEQTIEKQAESYIVAKSKKSKKGAFDEYKDFVRHFKNDVQKELRFCNPIQPQTQR